MRIDPALCTSILIAVENDSSAGTGKLLAINPDGYDNDVVAMHIKYLWDENLVTGIDCTNFQSPYPEIKITDITPAGRSYLDNRTLAEEPPPRKIGFQV